MANQRRQDLASAFLAHLMVEQRPGESVSVTSTDDGIEIGVEIALSGEEFARSGAASELSTTSVNRETFDDLDADDTAGHVDEILRQARGG